MRPTRATVVVAFAASILTIGTAGRLRYAEDRAPAALNPLFTTTMSEARLQELVFEGLFADDKELRSRPNLVASSTVDADRMGMTLTLKPGIRWHDGEALGADDVVFTIAAMKEAGTASTEAGKVAFIEDAVAADPMTVRLRFRGAEIAPEDKLQFKILPSHRFTSTTVSRSDPFRSRPIGTGPFALEEIAADGSISLVRHADYRDENHLDGVQMREVADTNYQAKLLVYQSLEALVRVVPRDLATLENDRGVELFPYQTNSWWYVGFNQANPLLADVRVREAISHLVDPEELMAPVGTGAVVTGPYVPSSPFYNHGVERRRVDPTRAAALLGQAGLVKDASGWTHRGEPLVLRVAAQENHEVAQDVIVALQAQLGRHGIRVAPTFLSTAAWRETVWERRDFDLVLSQWTFDRTEDIREQFHSSGARNFVGYRSPDTDRLLDRARATIDPQEKRALLMSAHERIAADAPMVFLFTLNSYAAVSVRVRDVQIHPFTFFTWARDWRVE